MSFIYVSALNRKKLTGEADLPRSSEATFEFKPLMERKKKI